MLLTSGKDVFSFCLLALDLFFSPALHLSHMNEASSEITFQTYHNRRINILIAALLNL